MNIGCIFILVVVYMQVDLILVLKRIDLAPFPIPIVPKSQFHSIRTGHFPPNCAPRHDFQTPRFAPQNSIRDTKFDRDIPHAMPYRSIKKSIQISFPFVRSQRSNSRNIAQQSVILLLIFRHFVLRGTSFNPHASRLKMRLGRPNQTERYPRQCSTYPSKKPFRFPRRSPVIDARNREISHSKVPQQ